MSELRRHFIIGLVLLMCTLTDHCGESAPSTVPTGDASAGMDEQQDLRRMVEIVKQVEGSQGRHSAKTEAPAISRETSSPMEQKDFRDLKVFRGNQAVGEFSSRKES